MKRLIVALSLISLSAYAGPKERELKTEVDTVIKSAAAAIKTGCGCNVKVDVKWESFKNDSDHIRQMKYAFEKWVTEAPEYCKDAASKTAICQMKAISYAKTDSGSLTFAKGTLAITTDGNSSYGWDAVAKEVDK